MRGGGVALLYLVITVLCFGTFPLPATANDWKIIPGERIGDASLAMSIDDALKALGPPTGVEQGDRLVRYEWNNLQLQVFQSLETGLISNIRTYWIPRAARGQTRVAQSYRTEKGIGIGATLEQIQQAFGSAGCFVRDLPSPRGNSRELAWSQLGAFFIMATDIRFPVEIRDKAREIGVRHKARGEPRFPGPPFKSCV